MTEQQPYDVVEQHDGFELRRYPSHVVAEVTVRGSFEGAGSMAFRALAGYINGQNEVRESVAMTAPVVQTAAPSQKVAMTAPVVQTPTSDGDYVVAFVLPASMTLDSAPVPTNLQVQVRAVPERLAAVARIPGRWSEPVYRSHLDELMRAVATAGLVPDGAPRSARFDPPYKPWFLRRNEVMQDVTRAET